MILYFIRHAQSENNALLDTPESQAARQEDPGLTMTGKIQADLLGKFLSRGCPSGANGSEPVDGGGFGITHFYTSLMVRAVETGTQVAEHFNIPLVGLVDLHECGGVFLEDIASGELRTLPGKSRTFFQETFPNCVLPDEMTNDGWWGSRPFETEDQRMARAARLLEYIRATHADKPDRVVIISHADFYNQFLGAVLEYSRKNTVWFSIHNTGITRIDFKGTDRRVVYTNRTAHLTPDLLTA